MYSTLISTEALAEHLGQPDWALIDCRFDLADPAWGFVNYQQGHLPGAVYAHLDRDLSGPPGPDTGRHPLPDIQEMAHRLSSWGIGKHTQVVVYDTSGGAFAVRLWWLLHFLDHPAAAVLDGGLQKWQRESRPLGTGIETRPAANFIPKPDWRLVADADEVDRIRQDPAYRLVDARSPERFRGEQEPIDPVAGHIPGAINRFHGANLSPEGTFLPPDVLRSQFEALIGATPPKNVIVYCGSGVTSIHHILAMELAELPKGTRLYAGSWSEWIRGGKRPIS